MYCCLVLYIVQFICVEKLCTISFIHEDLCAASLSVKFLILSNSSVVTYVFAAQKISNTHNLSCNETVLLSTHNICVEKYTCFWYS